MNNAWSRFWFQEGHYFNLAFLRVILVAYQIFWLLLFGFSEIAEHLEFSDSMFSALPVLKVLNVFWGWGIRPDAEIVYSVYVIGLLSGGFALVGLFTNIAMLVFAVANIYIVAFSYSFGDSHHPEAVMMIALLALSLSPCGKILSLDYLRYLSKGGKPLNEKESFVELKGRDAFWAIGLIQVFFGLMYWSAVSCKLVNSGADWANGYTLQYYLARDGLRWDSPLGVWASQFHIPVYLAQNLVFFFQATFMLCVFFPKLRFFYIPLGLCFHLGIYLTIRAPFPQWMLLYAAFIPWAHVIQWLNSKASAPNLAIRT